MTEQHPPSESDFIISKLKDYLQTEYLPMVQRMENDRIDARLAQAGVELQKVIDVVVAEMNEIKKARPAGPPALRQADGAPQPETLGDAAGNFLLRAEHFLDYVLDKGLPAWERIGQIRRASKYDLAWAQNLRLTDPVTAVVLASQLNPDPLASQLPLIMSGVATQAYTQGMRTRITAMQAVAAGGGASGQIPSSSYPASSVNPWPGLVAPVPVPQPAPTGANMQNKGAKGPSNGSTPPTSGVSQKVKRLAEILRS